MTMNDNRRNAGSLLLEKDGTLLRPEEIGCPGS